MPAPNVQTRNGSDLAVPLLSLSQPYTGATAVLVDELDVYRNAAASIGGLNRRYSFSLLRLQLRFVRRNERANVGRHVQQLQPLFFI
jgi:hypothetical protein